MADGNWEELVVGIRADLDQFKKDMKGVTNEATQVNSDMASSAKGFGATALASYAKVAAIAGVATVAIAGIVSVTGEWISAANEAASVERVLESQIRATGMAAGLTVEEIQALASARHGITAFEDDTTSAAAAILTSFTSIREDAFKRTLIVAQDVSTVMGGPLNSTVTQLGKALNNPTDGLGALSRAGIQFTDQQKEVVKWLQETNRLEEAQGLILGELERQYGGAAEAAVTPAQQIGLAWGDVQESLGFALLPTLNDIIGAIQGLISELMPAEDGVSGMGQAIRLLLSPITFAINLVTSWVKWQKLLVGTMQDVGSAINDYLGKPVQWIGKQLEWVRDRFIDLLKAVSKVPGAVGDMADTALGYLEASKEVTKQVHQEASSLASLEAEMVKTKKAAADFKAIQDGILATDETIKQREMEINTLIMSREQAELYKLAMQGMTNAQKQQVMAYQQTQLELEAVLKKRKEEEEQVKRSTDAFNSYKKQLEETTALFGLEGREREIAKMEMQGQSKERLKELRDLDAQIDVQEKQKKLMDRYKETIDGLKTPQQKFNDEVNKLVEIRHLLGEKNFEKGIKELREQFEEPFTMDMRVTGIDAVEAGSAEAMSRLTAFRAAIAKPTETLKLPDSVAKGGPLASWKEKYAERTGGLAPPGPSRGDQSYTALLKVSSGIDRLVAIEENKEADTETVNLDGG